MNDSATAEGGANRKFTIFVKSDLMFGRMKPIETITSSQPFIKQKSYVAKDLLGPEAYKTNKLLHTVNDSSYKTLYTSFSQLVSCF